MKNKNMFLFMTAILTSLISLSAFGVSLAKDTPSKLSGETLRSRVLTMRYCDYYVDGEYSQTFQFHRGGDLSASETGDNGAYGSGYGDAYGDAYGNGYDGGAYGGGKKSVKGNWSLTGDKSHISVTLDGWKRASILYFGTRSYYQHACYNNANSVP